MHRSQDLTMRLALPSKGTLEEPTLNFLTSCGLEVLRPNERQYVASIPLAPQLVILFQRAADIVSKVAGGSVEFGITGYDIVCEQSEGYDNVIIMQENLGYGKCELVLAIPESWIDVTSVTDLADLTVLFKDRGRELKIATKFPNLVRKWLYERGIVHFSLVQAEGTLEAAPSMGYADVIADLTATGTTLKENRLKRIAGGTILESQACLIGNRRLLLEDTGRLHMARMLLEFIEAHLRAKKYISITANVHGNSPEAIARNLVKGRDLAGLRGPTIAKVYSKAPGEDDWYMITITVEHNRLLDVIDHLRKAGGTDITVSRMEYNFESESTNFQRFVERLKREQP